MLLIFNKQEFSLLFRENCEMKNFILFGFKACGKSYFGRYLAQETGLCFIDSDQCIEALYTKEYGASLLCREIYKKIGNQAFRQLEYLAIASLVGMRNAVISLGGGTLIDPKNREILKNIGEFIYLEMDKEALKERLFSSFPAFLDPLDPDASFEALYQERKLIYEQIVAHKICLDGKPDEYILHQLKEIMHGK